MSLELHVLTVAATREVPVGDSLPLMAGMSSILGAARTQAPLPAWPFGTAPRPGAHRALCLPSPSEEAKFITGQPRDQGLTSSPPRGVRHAQPLKWSSGPATSWVHPGPVLSPGSPLRDPAPSGPHGQGFLLGTTGQGRVGVASTQLHPLPGQWQLCLDYLPCSCWRGS